jgi:hypothetical protein
LLKFVWLKGEGRKKKSRQRHMRYFLTKAAPTDHGGGKRRSSMVGSGRPFHPHHTKSGIKVYVDVQDQALRPSGECAKVCDGFCRYGDVAFNLDSHIVAVAEKESPHLLDCIGCVSHARSRANSNTGDLRAVDDRSEVHRRTMRNEAAREQCP